MTMTVRLLPLAAAVLAVVTLAGASGAADLNLPRVSQNAKVTQTVGLTDVTITYCRPGVKGRVIWGDLVPYEKVWRTGANEATTITFSTDVKLNGKELKAGTYSLFTIPTKGNWTVIFSREARQWGSFTYSDSTDALRLQATPEAHEFTEWMQFSFPSIAMDKATVALDWEKLRVPFEIQVNTIEAALASARAAMASLKPDDQGTAFRCASFAWANNVALDEARQWLDKSIAIKETWMNLRLKADMLAKDGKIKDAVATGERAVTLGEKDGPADEIAKMKKTVADWKAKM